MAIRPKPNNLVRVLVGGFVPLSLLLVVLFLAISFTTTKRVEYKRACPTLNETNNLTYQCEIKQFTKDNTNNLYKLRTHDNYYINALDTQSLLLPYGDSYVNNLTITLFKDPRIGLWVIRKVVISKQIQQITDTKQLTFTLLKDTSANTYLFRNNMPLQFKDIKSDNDMSAGTWCMTYEEVNQDNIKPIGFVNNKCSSPLESD